MEKNITHSLQQNTGEMDSLLAEMILDKALLDFRKEKIQQEIDSSLRDKNEEAFLRSTEKLKSIQLLYVLE